MEPALFFFLVVAAGCAVFFVTIGLIATDPNFVSPSDQPPGPNSIPGDSQPDGLYLGNGSDYSALTPGSPMR